jgi:cell division protease FtsH
MNIQDHIANHERCLHWAAQLLGRPVRAVNLSWTTDQRFRRLLVLEERVGLEHLHPLMTFSDGPKGQQMGYGVERYRAEIDGRPLYVARVVAPYCDEDCYAMYQFWAVAVEDHRRLYRLIRRQERESLDATPPILHDSDRRRIWENTVGFLLRGRDGLAKFGLPQKRGVILLGPPGNGKTMACRWLFAACQRRGLRWKSVSAHEYASACGNGTLPDLFEIDGQGIILFDDLDEPFRTQGDSKPDLHRSVFLTELDGLHARQGVVYLFTSNARAHELDPAFKRPGRIDLMIQFSAPDAELRRRFVIERWHAEIVAALDVDTVVEATDGMSFAEMEELKKLLVLRHLDQRDWNWDIAWKTYCRSRADSMNTRRIGFSDTASPARRSKSVTAG